jgi:D-beta-D-heptose 7-phosphate kinase/D-beta-D-heptose 1-phosphate adenosyltransferase
MNPKDIIHRFKDSKIIVVGDIMLDKYVLGSVERISPEAPIQVVCAREERLVLGGAANVASNILALGGRVSLVGVVGEDDPGRKVLSLLKEQNIDQEGVIVADGFHTTQKIRVLSQNQQLLRLDYEDKLKLHEDQTCKALRKIIPGSDTIIISDYAKGVITEKVMECIRTEAKKNSAKIIVDPKPSNKGLYHDVYLITPNQKEAEGLSGIKAEDESQVIDMGKKLKQEFRSNILMTRGEKGMILFSGKDTINIPTQAREVYDVSGAGDTAIATFALAVASGATLLDAAELANHAAGIVVGKLGTSTISREELLSVYERENKKAMKLEKLKAKLEVERRLGKKIVFTNGCFDILHTGHLQLLRKAKSFGDVLVVGLNTDASIKRLKGPERPILPEEERVEIISALEPVDYVVLFSEDDPCKIIAELKPDVHVKGGDYDPSDYVNMPEAKVVHEYGGEVKIVNLIDGKSTTNIIKKIMEK